MNGRPATGAAPPQGGRPTASERADRAREQRNAAMLSFATVLVLMLVVYVALFDADSALAAFDLNSWSEWAVFGAIALAAIGAGVAVQTRMR